MQDCCISIGLKIIQSSIKPSTWYTQAALSHHLPNVASVSLPTDHHWYPLNMQIEFPPSPKFSLCKCFIMGILLFCQLHKASFTFSFPYIDWFLQIWSALELPCGRMLNHQYMYSWHHNYFVVIFSCDQAALQMVFSVRLSVRLSVFPSVCLSHLFHHVPIIVSSWNFQELLPWSKVMSMQTVKVRGQRSRSQRSRPNLTVSGL